MGSVKAERSSQIRNETVWRFSNRRWFGPWVGTVSEEKYRQKRAAVSWEGRAMWKLEKISSYFKNLGCEGDRRGRRKVRQGKKGRVRGFCFFKMQET